MRRWTTTALIAVLAATGVARAAPFDEQTLDQIARLNRNISEHYGELQESSQDLEARRAIAEERIRAISEELAALDHAKL